MPPAELDALIERINAIVVGEFVSPSNTLALYEQRNRILAALTQARADREEVERLKRMLNWDSPGGVILLAKEVERLQSTNGYEVAAEWRDKFKKAEADLAATHTRIAKLERGLTLALSWMKVDAVAPLEDEQAVEALLATRTAAAKSKCSWCGEVRAERCASLDCPWTPAAKEGT